MALAETAKRKSKEWHKRWDTPGNSDVAHAQRQRIYGMTPEQYIAMLTAQAHGCALCGKPETSTTKSTVRSLAVDHDHSTGQVRGVLCTRCNQLVGHLEKQDRGWAGKAEAYLAYHAGQPHTHGAWCHCLDTPGTPHPPKVSAPTHATHTVDAELAHIYQVCQRCYASSDNAYCSDACATGDLEAMRTRWR